MSKDSLKLIEKDSVGEYSELPYIDLSTIESCHNGQPVTVLYDRDKSMNLDKNEIKDFTLVFKGHISSSARTLSLLQNNEERYFSFTDIPVAFDYHSDWELKYKNEQEIIDAIDKSNVPICGIYENNNGLRFACLKEGSKYNLICLDTSNDYKWSFGDIKGYFSETLNPLVFKGYKYGNRFKSQYNSNYIVNGNFIEIVSDQEKESFRKYGEIPPADESLLRIYPTKKTDIENIGSYWSGSGFALKDGYIITNNHVADGATEIMVFGIDGDLKKGYKAKVIGKDKVRDLALLQIEDNINADFWNAIPYSIKTNMSDVGESIYALGYPLIGTMGEEVKLTTGVISSRSGFEGDVTNYQISAPIQPGNSGGPMFDEDGDIVGIVCAKHEGAENVGYAIKTSYLLNLIESVADLGILPKGKELKGLSMKNQVKLIRDYTFLIKCTK